MPTEVPLVKSVAAILYKDEPVLQQGLARFRSLTGSTVDFQGPPHPFDHTDYYETEMGAGLSRVIVSFSPLVEPASLVEAKWQAHGVEQALAVNERRTVNVDVGYLDLFKLVLASFKGRGNKLYLERGVWADMTLTYEKGAFKELPWTFPDFRSGAYAEEFLEIRRIYKRQIGSV